MNTKRVLTFFSLCLAGWFLVWLISQDQKTTTAEELLVLVVIVGVYFLASISDSLEAIASSLGQEDQEVESEKTLSPY